MHSTNSITAKLMTVLLVDIQDWCRLIPLPAPVKDSHQNLQNNSLY